MQSGPMILIACLLATGCAESASTDTDHATHNLVSGQTSDSDALQGEWKLETAGVAGNTIDRSQDSPPTTMQVSGNVLREFVSGDLSTEARFTLETDSNSKRITLTYLDESEVAEVGIYKVEGDSLTLCRCPVARGYPDDFATTKGDSRTLQIFRRL